MLARLLLAMSEYNSLQSNGLRMSNGRRGRRKALDVKNFFLFFLKKREGRSPLFSFMRVIDTSHSADKNTIACKRYDVQSFLQVFFLWPNTVP